MLDGAGDTIFALSSGSVPSGVAVMRLSGPRSIQAVETLARKGVPTDRCLVRRDLFDPASGELIDRGMVVVFVAPASFTGEECAELHLHGSPAVVQAVSRCLGQLPGLRPAEPGEFSRRAFRNGKLDLTAAEGLADLIEAETDEQRRQATRMAGGANRRLYDEWRGRLVRLWAHLEAQTDFSDQDDVGPELPGTFRSSLAELGDIIDAHLAGYRVGEIVRRGFRVAIIGRPNAGKSSLLNALASRDVAIVTDVPGTTRDVIEVPLDIGGFKVVVTDTAGLRDTDDPVEKIGVDRARLAAAEADLLVELRRVDDRSDWLAIDTTVRRLRVASQADRGRPVFASDLVLTIADREGLAPLVEVITRELTALRVTVEAVPTRERHVALLRAALDALRRTTDVNELELVAEELRVAALALGRLTGDVDVEDLLDVIFSEFCIGK